MNSVVSWFEVFSDEMYASLTVVMGVDSRPYARNNSPEATPYATFGSLPITNTVGPEPFISVLVADEPNHRSKFITKL